MTETELIELITHPMVQRMVRRLAREEARAAILAKEEPQAPRGHVSITKAALMLGYAKSSVRSYKCNGLLQGKRGYVTIASVDRLLKRRAK
mgnify:CR=1 FL=1